MWETAFNTFLERNLNVYTEFSIFSGTFGGVFMRIFAQFYINS